MNRNKKCVIAFYDCMFNRNDPKAAVENYVGEEYIQHNPHVASGIEAFIDYFEKMAREHPKKKVSFKRVLAEGNYVMLHCHQQWDGGDDYAGIDIFRLDDDGKIVEHWDVLQVMPQTLAHDNGMF